ncbi:hypothetical protein [Enterococcus sp. AZ192]|uniref:hypothetical protein n=1 Tax=unclassified Enterococcus TaxID=2608891 RepID=UPI003D2C8F9E
MTDNSKIEKGELFNLSFDDKKVVLGWVLLLTQDNEEYLIRQNSGLIGFGKHKIKREIYKSNVGLRDKIISKDEMKIAMKKKSERNFIGISIGIVLSAILRHSIEKSWIFGETNFPPNILTGIFNLMIFWTIFSLIFYLISKYRKQRFLSNVEKFCNGDLDLVGKGYEINVSLEKKVPIKNILPLIFLIGIIVFVTIILPFLVQERLFAILITVIALLLFFNGNTILNKKKVEYLITRMEK